MITISVKVDPQILIDQPERVVQLFSFKVCEKREQHLQQYIGKVIKYKDPQTNNQRSGELKKVYNGECCIIRQGKLLKMSISHISWE